MTGTPKTKLADVAQRAGVSIATASLVVNERPGVNARTRRRVLAAAEELGYVRNNIARSLATRSSRTLALVVTDIENPFFGSLTRYVDECARRHRFSLLLAVSGDDPALEDRILRHLVAECVDGIVVVPTQFAREDLDAFAMLRRRNLPFVFATTYYPGCEGDCVMTDLELGSLRLTRYLLALGHRDIAFLVGADREAPISKLRVQGFLRAFAELGLACDPARVVPCARPDFQSGYAETRRLLAGRRPHAVITINDLMALGAHRACRDAGLSVPRDLSIAGYDDVVFASVSELHFTTVRQDLPTLARLSVDLLVRRIRGRAAPAGQTLLPPDLMVRDSTGAPRGIGPAGPLTRGAR